MTNLLVQFPFDWMNILISWILSNVASRNLPSIILSSTFTGLKIGSIFKWSVIEHETLGVYTTRTGLLHGVVFHFRSEPQNRKLTVFGNRKLNEMKRETFITKTHELSDEILFDFRFRCFPLPVSGKQPTSGFDLSTGCGKLPHAIARI